MLARSLRALQEAATVGPIVLVVPRAMDRKARATWGRALSALDPLHVRAIVPGGAHRVLSVRAGLRAFGPHAPPVVVVHDAARPLAGGDLVDRVARAAARHGAAIAAAPATDTVKRGHGGLVRETIPRREVFLAQTPQAFRTRLLVRCLDRVGDRDAAAVTDEASLIEAAGGRVAIVEAPRANLKVTDRADLAVAAALLCGAAGERRVGHGFDLHRLVKGRPLLLGGVAIPSPRGLLGHSDGDVVLHAITDALLGAAGEPDIGSLFSDRDPAWRGADSRVFLAEALRRVTSRGYEIENVDVVLHAERPKLAPHYGAIAASVAAALGIDRDRCGVKAKTHEGLGDIGRGRALAATAFVLLARSAAGAASGGRSVR